MHACSSLSMLAMLQIYCLTQFNSASLNRHLSQAYVRGFGCMVALLTARAYLMLLPFE